MMMMIDDDDDDVYDDDYEETYSHIMIVYRENNINAI